MIGKIYTGTLDEAGANKVAEEFAADILKQFGGVSLMGTKIYFVSDRTGNKEIWSMDYDGSNQKPITSYRSITTVPVRLAGRHEDCLHHLRAGHAEHLRALAAKPAASCLSIIRTPP